MAITKSVWIKLPVSIPGIIPSIPSSQTVMQITATSHNKFLILLFFVVHVVVHVVV